MFFHRRLTLTDRQRQQVRELAYSAMCYYPNSHLGDYTRREDLRSLFRMVRSHADAYGVASALSHAWKSVQSHADM